MSRRRRAPEEPGPTRIILVCTDQGSHPYRRLNVLTLQASPPLPGFRPPMPTPGVDAREAYPAPELLAGADREMQEEIWATDEDGRIVGRGYRAVCPSCPYDGVWTRDRLTGVLRELERTSRDSYTVDVSYGATVS